MLFLVPLLIAMALTMMIPFDYEWLQELRQRSYIPHPMVFSIVWPILYLLLGIVLQRTDDTSAQKILAVNLFLNYLWIIVFNYFKNIRLAFIISLLLVLTLYYYLQTEWQHSAPLLIPYFLWTIYATYLNWSLIL